ncbi:MAG: hypothetical protein ABJ022_09730, partial [Marinobacter alexandrii]
RDLGRYKERIVFFIALTLFAVLGPAIILMLSILGSTQVPGFVAFVQPILLIIAISLYSTAVSISNILTRFGTEGVDSGADYGDASTGGQHADEARPSPLDLPRRSGNDPL